MFGSSLLGANGGITAPLDLSQGLLAHYLLNNNADDNAGTFDGTVVGTVDFQGDQVDPLTGSITIPATGGVWCSYWVDTGTGMTHTTSSTVPSSLATNKYSNLRIYDAVKGAEFIALLLAEGYYPKPLPLPTTVGLVAHYPLTGTAEDITGNYDSTEVSATYVDDAEYGSVFSGTGSITVNTTATGLATWCCYWVDSGAGWVFTKTTTIPSSLTSNKYRNLRLYSLTPSTTLQDEIEEYEKNFRPIDIDDGLVAYYPLADNSLDNYKNQYDGTDTSMTYDGLSGVLNGTNSNIAIHNTLIRGGDVSVSAWILRNDTVDSNDTIMTQDERNTGTYRSFHFNLSDIGTVVTLIGTSVSVISTAGTVPRDSTYHHVVFTYDSVAAVVKIYIDRTGQTTTGTVLAVRGNGRRGNIGARIDNAGGIFDVVKGNLAHVREYNKPLTAEQIEVIYNTEKGDFGL